MDNYTKLIEAANSLNELINIVERDNRALETQIKNNREKKYIHIYEFLIKISEVIKKCKLYNEPIQIMTNIYGIDSKYPRTAAILFQFNAIYIGEYYIGSKNVSKDYLLYTSIYNTANNNKWFYEFIDRWSEKTEEFINSAVNRTITELLQKKANKVAQRNKELNEDINNGLQDN